MFKCTNTNITSRELIQLRYHKHKLYYNKNEYYYANTNISYIIKRINPERTYYKYKLKLSRQWILLDYHKYKSCIIKRMNYVINYEKYRLYYQENECYKSLSQILFLNGLILVINQSNEIQREITSVMIWLILQENIWINQICLYFIHQISIIPYT